MQQEAFTGVSTWRCFFAAIPKGQRGQRANVAVVALAPEPCSCCRFVKLPLLEPSQPNVSVYVATLVCVMFKSKCLYLPLIPSEMLKKYSHLHNK